MISNQQQINRNGCKKLNDSILQAAEVHFASGRRTVVSGADVVSGARIVNEAPKKKHLIEAAPFGRLDQMLRTTV